MKQAFIEHFGIGSKHAKLFQKLDWITMGVTFFIAFIGYLITLAPDLTLQDSGELAVGSYYAGVPHPPGYPVWTIYTWLFTVLVPIANVAYRVAISSAFASALSCGIIAMLISRGASLFLAQMPNIATLDQKLQKYICMISGLAGGLIFGYNGFIWSQSVIAEVYTLSVLSLTVVLILMMRWMYAPEQRQYLYAAMFVFGICFTNHQTLLLAAMGLEMMIILIRPSLGREVLMGNSLIFFYVLHGALNEQYANLTPEKAIFGIFIVVGVCSIAGFVYLAIKEKYILKEFWHNFVATLCAGICWVIGNVFYFFMPISSMTNPPMNWGYARTVKGFFHALTRGQYESAKPTSDILAFFDQIRIYTVGAMQEFSIIFLLLALIPFIILFFVKLEKVHKKRYCWILSIYSAFFLIGLLGAMKPHDQVNLQTIQPLLYAKSPWTYIGFLSGAAILMLVATPFVFFKQIRENFRLSWIAGTSSVFFCLAILLLVVLNPTADKQSQELHKVFFTASYVFISIWIGYGLALLLGLLATKYDECREYSIYGAAVILGLATYGLVATLTESSNPLFIATSIFGVLMALAVMVFLYTKQKQAPMKVLLIVVLCMPVYTAMSHWWENEQREHLFGFWYGHDMFTPPFKDGLGEPLYPEMTKNAILFGGTDPGRFCPTYMIFCESFIPPEKRRDPDFDRRDVYIITQNALADETYLDYIRAHYFRSAQEDENFFQELFPSQKYPWLGWLTKPLDSFFLDLGAKVEARRRAEGVYPEKEIYVPSGLDHFNVIMEYQKDLQKRYETNQLRPGEESYNPETGAFPTGQVAVMAINGYLTKIIFDKNPNNDFFVEESFALDWMYPYLTPYGIILKLNREPVKQFTEDIIGRDHEFWCQYMDRLCGDWIKYETTTDELCQFAEDVYLHGKFKNYKGDMKFVRDNDAQKSFSKLRSAITGLYWWRINGATSVEEQQMLLREAEFAGKQAYALCPFSPEALYKLVNIYLVQSRYQDAQKLILNSLLFDPENHGLEELLLRIAYMEQNQKNTQELSELQKLEESFMADPKDPSNAITYATACLNANKLELGQKILLTFLPQLKEQNDKDPLDTKNAMYLFSVYRLLDKTTEARAVIEKILESQDASPAAVIACAQAILQLGDVDYTIKILERASALVPDSAEILYDLAAIQAMLEQPEALTNLNKAITLNQTQIKSNTNLTDLKLVLKSDARFSKLRNKEGFPK